MWGQYEVPGSPGKAAAGPGRPRLAQYMLVAGGGLDNPKPGAGCELEPTLCRAVGAVLPHTGMLMGKAVL